MKECPVCNKEISEDQLKRKPKTIYCSPKCRAKGYYAGVNKISFPNSDLSRNMRGAISENMVAVEMMEQGYEVFMNVAHFGKTDLIAVKGEEVRLLQVKTGRYSARGCLTYPNVRDYGSTELVVVTPDKIYFLDREDKHLKKPYTYKKYRR